MIKGMIERGNRAVEILRTQGSLALVNSVRDFLIKRVRPYTSKKTNVYNGVLIERFHWVDRFRSQVEMDDRPLYEGQLIEQAENHVSPGDTVVVLGGGVGVTSVRVANIVGADGEVHVYEGAEEMVDMHTRTQELNPVEAPIELHHAIVGDVKQLWGESGKAKRVEPEQLPLPDVFIIDIEGSEANVVPMLEDAETMIIETHGKYGSTTENMTRHLSDRGYEVTVEGVAEPSMEAQNIADDIKVVVAQQI
jgi:hypothetical protein